ncbi:MAG: hypothetical protein GY749_23715 [Desulfobacteraceae bacterium]|nr:hypothetical protein [Desulfobacteraceae bacterium]
MGPKVRKLLLSVTALMLVAGTPNFSDACSAYIVGTDATADGSVILAGQDDWPGFAGRVARVQGKKHKMGDTYVLISGDEIPQVDETYAYNYNSCVYDMGTRKDASWLYGMNEHQVAVSMNGTYTYKDIELEGTNIIQGDDLTVLVLERAKTAREAVEMLGTLIDKYGFKASDPESGSGSITMAVADTTEGWWFDPLPGGKWVAERVADNKVSVRTNGYGTHVVNLKDKKNFLGSGDLIEYATKKGWYNPEDGAFDFVKAYTYEGGKLKAYDESGKYNNYRRWRYLSLFAGKDMPLNEYIYDVVPNKKITIQDAMTILRDNLTGTQFDPTEEPISQPFKNPYSPGKKNAINMAGTVVSQVAQLRSWLPNEIGGIMWVAMDTPTTSVYLPWYAGINSIPETFVAAETGVYDENAAWWVFNEVGNLTRRVYNRAAFDDVIPSWSRFEKDQFESNQSAEKVALDLYKTSGKEAASKFLTEYSGSQGLRAYEKAKKLANYLRGKYSDNVVTGVVKWTDVE